MGKVFGYGYETRGIFLDYFMDKFNLMPNVIYVFKVRLVRPITPVSLRQNVRVRHLEPPDLPTPNPIIIKERQLTPPPPAPPVYIRQYQPAPPTPPPLVIRERPPVAPKMPETTYIEKIIPPPSPPPRQVVIERIPAPEKPRDVIYEVKKY
jgi:hypothetical protein